VTAARLGRESVEVLLDPPTPAVRAARETVEVLLDPPTPSARMARISVNVLIPRSRAFVGWGIPI
jgi:hypothetical protein